MGYRRSDHQVQTTTINIQGISKEEYGGSQLQLAKDTYVATAAAFGIIAVHNVFDNIQRLEGGMFY
jgi:hypothetical protein